MTLCASALVQLLLIPRTAGFSCKKIRPQYSPDAIPRFTGSVGPFGTVCEVRTESSFPPLPSVPESLNVDEAFVVRSSYPDHFLEQSAVTLKPLANADASHARSLRRSSNVHLIKDNKTDASAPLECGIGLSVAAAGPMMNEKVIGLSAFGSGDDWLAGCIACGTTLEANGSLKSGWFCQLSWLGPKPIGAWLKRLGDTSKSSTVNVDMSHLGHEVYGFGGAFTDAAAFADNSLQDPSLKIKWVESYFGPTGLGYTMGRVPFGGSDFSRQAYSLDDVAGDLNLTHMCLRDDRVNASCGEDAKLSIIKSAFQKEPALKLFFSPWSAPAWMKTSSSYVGGAIKGLGRGQWSSDDKLIAMAWARSYVKFVDLLAEEGITVWGFTLQNEPGNKDFAFFNTDPMDGDTELALLQLVGPLMRAKYPNIKIMVHDDQVYSLQQRLAQQGSGLLISDYMDGVAFHWYGSISGTFENVTATYAVPGLPLGPKMFGGGIQVREIYQTFLAENNKFMLGTEACNGWFNSEAHLLEDMRALSNNRGVRPGDWHRGYRYSRDIFYAIVNGASGWTDWNLLLNWEGGPNWSKNNVDAPILVSPDGKALWVSPMYFHLAHWAKYVIPGSRVLQVRHDNSELHEVAAFLRPDKRIVVVALCDNIDGLGDPPANQVLNIVVGDMVLELGMLSRSIVTAVFNVPNMRPDTPVFV